MFFILSRLSLSNIAIPNCGTNVQCNYLDTALSINGQAGGEVTATAFADLKTKFTSLTLLEVETIGENAFKGFSNLEEINILGNVKAIKTNAFADCPKISYIYYFGENGPKGTDSGLKTDVKIFVDTYTAPDKKFCGIPVVFTSGKFGSAGLNNEVEWKFLLSTSELTIKPIGSNTKGYMSSVGDVSPFEQIKDITKSIVLDGIIIASTNCFKGFTELVSVDIKKEGFTTFAANSFEGCIKLPTITIQATVETIEKDAFKGCVALESITYLGTDAEKYEVFPPTFEKLPNLKKAYVPLKYPANKFWGVPVTYKEEYGKFNKVTWELDKTTGKFTLYSNKDNHGGIVDNNYPLTKSPFDSVKESVKEVTIRSNIKSICMNCFKGFNKLTTVTFEAPVKAAGAEVTSPAITIGEYAFSECTLLSSVTLPTEGLSKISASLFEGCTALKELVIPASVEEIGASAFKNTGLEKLQYLGTHDFSKLENAGIPDSAKIYVTKEYKHGKFAGSSVSVIENEEGGSSDPEGTSTGVIVAVVIVVIVVVAAIGFCVYWFVLKPKKEQAPQEEEKKPEDNIENGKEGDEYYVPKEAEN